MAGSKPRKKPYYRGGAKTVGSYLSGVTRPVFEKFGFQRAALLTDWDSIVGSPLCHFTAPEQIKWQKSRNEKAEVEQFGQQDGATLVIRVEGPAALEVQHQAPQIIERINSYFGFRAVGDIRILQAPLVTSPLEPQIKRHDLDKPLQKDVKLDKLDERMETAFKRLWRGIQLRKNNDPTKK